MDKNKKLAENEIDDVIFQFEVTGEGMPSLDDGDVLYFESEIETMFFKEDKQTVAKSDFGSAGNTLDVLNKLPIADDLNQNTTFMYIKKFLLEKIQSNEKTVEARIASYNYSSISVGDNIQFICGKETVMRVVTASRKFSTFKQMSEAEGLQNCLPGANDLREGIEFFYGLPKHEELEKSYGVISFRLQPADILSVFEYDLKIDKSWYEANKFDGSQGVIKKTYKLSEVPPPTKLAAPINITPSEIKFKMENLENERKIELNSIGPLRKVEIISNKKPVWDEFDDTDIPNTQELLKTAIEMKPPTKSTAKALQPSRNINWLKTGKTYEMSQELFDAVYDSQRRRHCHETFLYRKDSIAIEIDPIFPGCVIYIDKCSDAQKFWKLRAYCAHDGCRRYCLTASHLTPSTFTIEFDKEEISHKFPLTRQLRRFERKQVEEESKNKFPSDVRREMLKSVDKDTVAAGNYQRVVSASVLEKVRSVATSSQDNAKDDVEDVEAMFSNDAQTNNISNILSRKKFAVYVHGKQQHEVLHNLHKLRELYGIQIVVRVDASGGIARDIDEFRMLYYALVVHVFIHEDRNSTPLPLSEQFNTRHSSKDIAAWLFDFILSHCYYYNDPPLLFDWIITDFSYANFHAILRAFNSMTLKDYLNLTRDWLEYKLQNEKFSDDFYQIVKIRMCYTHLMHTFAEMTKRLYGKNKNKQLPHSRIILEILAKMIECTDYEHLLQLWKQLVILLKSEFVNDEVDKAILEINSVTATVNIEDYDEEKLTQAVLDLDALQEYDSTLYKSNRFYVEFSTVAENIENYCYNNQEKVKNVYYNSEFMEKFLIRFVPLVPFWTRLLQYKQEPSVKTKPPQSILDCDHNQPIETFFGYYKMKMDTNAVSIGRRPVKVGRAIIFSEELRQSAIISILSNIPKERLNTQKPRKPYVLKKIANATGSVSATQVSNTLVGVDHTLVGVKDNDVDASVPIQVSDTLVGVDHSDVNASVPIQVSDTLVGVKDNDVNASVPIQVSDTLVGVEDNDVNASVPIQVSDTLVGVDHSDVNASVPIQVSDTLVGVKDNDVDASVPIQVSDTLVGVKDNDVDASVPIQVSDTLVGVDHSDVNASVPIQVSDTLVGVKDNDDNASVPIQVSDTLVGVEDNDVNASVPIQVSDTLVGVDHSDVNASVPVPVNLETESCTFAEAKESYNKRRPIKQFSYFQGKGISKIVKKHTMSAKTRKSPSRKVFKNALWQDVLLYADVNFNFIVSSKNGSFLTNKEFDLLAPEIQRKAVKESDNMLDLCLICGAAESIITMVECTGCFRWMHCPCINVTVAEVENDDSFKCPLCKYLNF